MKEDSLRERIRTKAKDVVFHGIRIAETAARWIDSGRPAVDRESLLQIRNIILPLFDTALGSAVHATPLVEALRSTMPDACIVAAACGLAQEVFQYHPALNDVVPVPDPNRDLWGSIRGLKKIVSSFQGEPYLVLLTPWNARSRVSLAAMLSGNGVRVGYAVGRPLVHLPLEFNRKQSQIANNLRLLQLLGYPLPNTLEPRVYFGPEDREKASMLLSEFGPLDGRPLAVLITQSSRMQRKGWRAERFVSVARWLIHRHGCRVVLVGSASEAETIENIRRGIGEACISLAGRTSITVLTAVLASADVALTLDTGILHIARAINLPACIIAPAWSPVEEWLPLGNSRFHVLKNQDLPEAPADYIIDEVSEADVRTSLDKLLTDFPPSANSREQRMRRCMAGFAGDGTGRSIRERVPIS